MASGKRQAEANVIFETLEPAAYGGISFPVKNVTISGGMRDHVHEFPHTHGGQPEKLGRRLYDIKATLPMHNTFRRYPQLWPDGVRDLFKLFDSGKTNRLSLPTLGVVMAYAVSWSKASSEKAFSGEEVEVTFREDTSDDHLVAGDLLPSTNGLNAEMDAFTYVAKEEDDGVSLGVFLDNLQSSVNQITGIADQAQVQGDLFAARIQKVCDMCQQIDQARAFFHNPVNDNVTQALHNLWFAAEKLKANAVEDTTRAGSDLRNGASRTGIALRGAANFFAGYDEFTTPISLTVTQVAMIVLHDASRAQEILKMNYIPNPFNIPAGTRLFVPYVLAPLPTPPECPLCANDLRDQATPERDRRRA